MAFAFVGSSNATATGATEVDNVVPVGVAAGQLILTAIAFENVASGSGPWIIPNNGQFSANYIGPSTGWQQLCFQAPSGTGTGLEVWGAIYTSGTNQNAMFAASQNAVMVAAAWSGEYNPTNLIGGAPPRQTATRQVTGNAPAAPSVTANSGDLIVACGGDVMTAAKFGTPSGFTNRVDVLRSGAGTVDAAIADRTATTAGATGLITFPNNASTGTTLGATATLLIIPAPATAGSGGIINAGLPEDLDIGAGYTLRVTALDPSSGNPVSGVTVSNLIFTADQVAGTPGELETGPFMLVPGPNA